MPNSPKDLLHFITEAQSQAYDDGYNARFKNMKKDAAPKTAVREHWIAGWDHAHHDMTAAPPEDD